MIPREILEKALADYEKAVVDIQGMERRSAMEYLEDNSMDCGLCYYLRVKFDVCEESLETVFGGAYLGGKPTLDYFSERHLPTLTSRLQLRIDKLKELLEK